MPRNMRSFSQTTDTQLVIAFQNGSVPAFEELISRYKDKLYTSIFFLVKDKYLAEDLFQETFIKIIDTLRTGRYNEEGKFLQWAMRIAHNLCVDYFRKVKRSPTILTSDDKDIFEVLYFADESPEQKVIRSQ